MNFFVLLTMLSLFSGSGGVFSDIAVNSPLRPYRIAFDQTRTIKKVEVIWQPVTTNACARLVVGGEPLELKAVTSNEASWTVNLSAASGKIEIMGLAQILSVKVSYYKATRVSRVKGIPQPSPENWFYPGESIPISTDPAGGLSRVRIFWTDAGGDARASLVAGEMRIGEKPADPTGTACWNTEHAVGDLTLKVLHDIVQIRSLHLVYQDRTVVMTVADKKLREVQDE
ncbi:MAG: hypothetical protein PHQ23_17580 [Candidatus Wallbacteria bacterium]|nr:hypothetical protein [Candidatus Wallbacteria bacterium]